MTIVDQDGRLFGRMNVFDAALLLLLVAMGVMGAVGFTLLRVPAAPVITVVAPATQTAGPGLRVTLQGQNLLPFLRAFLQRTGQPAAAMTRPAQATSIDSYTLVNQARVPFLVESPVLAEIRLPDGLVPGTYDLILHDDNKIVALRLSAFTIAPAPVVVKASTEPEGTVRVSGAFTGLQSDSAVAITVGTKVPYGASDPWGEILSVKPKVPDSGRVNFEGGRLMVEMRNRWQVPAVLRLVCTVTRFKCWLPNEVVVEPGANLSIGVAGAAVNFAVTDVTTDPPQAVTTLTMTVRFLTRPELAALPREQDADISPGGDRARPARIHAIQRRGEMTGPFAEPLADGSIQVPESIAVLECTVQVPVVFTETGWQYRSQAIKAGAPITFQTDQYIMRGVIRNVTRVGSDAAAR